MSLSYLQNEELPKFYWYCIGISRIEFRLILFNFVVALAECEVRRELASNECAMTFNLCTEAGAHYIVHMRMISYVCNVVLKRRNELVMPLISVCSMGMMADNYDENELVTTEFDHGKQPKKLISS